MSRDELYFKLKEHQVLGRRYFYPLISTFSTYRELKSAERESACCYKDCGTGDLFADASCIE